MPMPVFYGEVAAGDIAPLPDGATLTSVELNIRGRAMNQGGAQGTKYEGRLHTADGNLAALFVAPDFDNPSFPTLDTAYDQTWQSLDTGLQAQVFAEGGYLRLSRILELDGTETTAHSGMTIYSASLTVTYEGPAVVSDARVRSRVNFFR